MWTQISTLSVRRIASYVGVSYESIRLWTAGYKRVDRPENVAKIRAALAAEVGAVSDEFWHLLEQRTRLLAEKLFAAELEVVVNSRGGPVTIAQIETLLASLSPAGQLSNMGASA